MSDLLRPLLILLAGLMGLAGVALAAAATHATGGALLGPASAMCLAHAPAIIALVAARDAVRTATAAGLVMAVGVALFAGDLAMRQFTGAHLFPMAAPIGGSTMIIGWIVAAAGGFFPARPR